MTSVRYNNIWFDECDRVPICMTGYDYRNKLLASYLEMYPPTSGFRSIMAFLVHLPKIGSHHARDIINGLTLYHFYDGYYISNHHLNYKRLLLSDTMRVIVDKKRREDNSLRFIEFWNCSYVDWRLP